jgi:hypothetical protein
MSWTANKIVALAIGIIFTLVGIVGFFYSSTMTAASLFGFDVDLVHNIVHLVTGVLGIIAAFTAYSVWYNRVFGIVYLLIALVGFIPQATMSGMFLGLMHVNMPDHFLHLIVGLILGATGFGLVDMLFTRRPSTARPSA